MTQNLTSTNFINNLSKLSTKEDFSDVTMKQLFDLAKEFTNMQPQEIEKLLLNDKYKIRLGGVCIMDFQARSKKTSENRKKVLFDLYINHHDRVNTWDMVDRAAPFVVGGYLADKPRDILYKLAVSQDMCQRRTAIVATYFFIKQNDLEDTFKIAEILVYDKEDLIQKAVGGWIREAGKKDVKKLLEFLDKYAKTMPRTTLRYAIEHLDSATKKYYMELKNVI
jgi:3-methyladenine DNA glycosylase AlkD